ncbi:MAG: histidinol-phosphate transaminase [Siphonobacter sp.]
MNPKYVLICGLGLFLLTIAGSAQTPIQLSLNENPYGPPAGVSKRITAELAKVPRYIQTEPDTLVAAIARKEGVDQEQIILGELLEPLGIYLGLRGGPGGEFLYAVPGYPALVEAAARVGGTIISIPLNERKENDLAAFRAALSAKTQALFLVNPHNPSGTVSDSRQFHTFLHEVSRQALIIVDEAYLEFSDDFEGRTAVINTRLGDNVLVFRTFAKAYGMAGLSLGYAVAPKELARWLKTQGLSNSHDLNRLSVQAALAALEDKQYLPRVHQIINQERTKWNTILADLKLPHTESQANFVYLDTGKPYEVVAAHFRKNGIIIGRAFAPYATWVRISIGLPQENVRAQATLRELLSKK